jgi:hypothetical protein
MIFVLRVMVFSSLTLGRIGNGRAWVN